MDISDLPPVTGVWPPEDEQREVRELPPHEGFNHAIRDAVNRAADAWHEKGADPVKIWAEVDLLARVDIYNPGGIGQYAARLTPTSGPGG